MEPRVQTKDGLQGVGDGSVDEVPAIQGVEFNPRIPCLKSRNGGMSMLEALLLGRRSNVSFWSLLAGYLS